MGTRVAAPAKTRDRILQTSLDLFNQEGLASVSTHRIAAELGISPGNLHYHFRTKEQLAVWLVRRFEVRLGPCIDAHASVAALDDLWLALHFTYEAINEYRFVYRDIEHLLHEFPVLAPQAQALTARNLVAAKALTARLNVAGIIRASPEDEEMLALQMVFTMTCWFSFKRLAPATRASFSDPAMAAYYTLTLLSPYVMDESRAYLNYLRAKYLK